MHSGDFGPDPGMNHVEGGEKGGGRGACCCCQEPGNWEYDFNEAFDVEPKLLRWEQRVTQHIRVLMDLTVVSAWNH